MISVIFVLFVACLPYVSSSPTPSASLEAIHTLNKNSEPYTAGAHVQQEPSRERPFAAPSSPVWFGQPRAHANQFLMSHIDDNEVLVPKWFTRLNQNDDNDGDDAASLHKRSPHFPPGTYTTLKKRKQVAKPPMEVMNEIVNSIYLKR